MLYKRTSQRYNVNDISAMPVDCKEKDMTMEITLEARLQKLLNAYAHRYDIVQNAEETGNQWPATATYYLRDENYLISKQHVLSAVEQHEYLYFFLSDHLTAVDLQTQIALTKEAGLRKVRPHKEHMFSNIGLVILANTIDPEAKKLLQKTRFRKNYRLTFWGWTDYQLAAMEVSTNSFYSNPAGIGVKKLLEQNLAPKTDRRK